MGKFRMLFSVLETGFKSIAGILQVNLSLSDPNMTHTQTQFPDLSGNSYQ